MDILLTLDYELYNGLKGGTVQNCLIIPTEQLLKVLDKYNFKATFFVDMCFVNRLKKEVSVNPELKSDWDILINQLKKLSSDGHDLQLHLHPNWYNASYINGQWHSVVDDYKLSDMPEQVVHEMFRDGIKELQTITGKPITAFRAGAYCLPTLKDYSSIFRKFGIKVDSSVNRGKKATSEKWAQFDYTHVPREYSYSFKDDVTIKNDSGDFVEVSIPNHKINWFVAEVNRLFKRKENTTMWGDGSSSTGGGLLPMHKRLFEKLKKHLKARYIVASIDGNGTDLAYIYRREVEKKSHYMLIMGHPKCFTMKSLSQLDKFLFEYHELCTNKVVSNMK